MVIGMVNLNKCIFRNSMSCQFFRKNTHKSRYLILIVNGRVNVDFDVKIVIDEYVI